MFSFLLTAFYGLRSTWVHTPQIISTLLLDAHCSIHTECLSRGKHARKHLLGPLTSPQFVFIICTIYLKKWSSSAHISCPTKSRFFLDLTYPSSIFSNPIHLLRQQSSSASLATLTHALKALQQNKERIKSGLQTYQTALSLSCCCSLVTKSCLILLQPRGL